MTHVNTPFATLLGSGDVDIASASFGVLLVMSDSTAEAEKDAATIGDITTLDEFDGSGYSAEGQALTSVTWTEEPGDDRAVMDCDDPSFANLGNGTRPIVAAVFYQELGGTFADNPIVGVQSLGSFNPDGSTIPLAVPAAGLLHLRALTN